MLYVRDGLQETVVPLVASHGHYSTFTERFFQQATRDMTSYCVAPTAIDFYNKIGGMVLMQFNYYDKEMSPLGRCPRFSFI